MEAHELRLHIHHYLVDSKEVDSIEILNLLYEYFRLKKDSWKGLDWHETIYAEDGLEYYFDGSILSEVPISFPLKYEETAKAVASKIEIHAKEALECIELAVDLAFKFKIEEAYFKAEEAYQIESLYHKDFAPIWGDFCLVLRKFCMARKALKEKEKGIGVQSSH